MFMPPKNPEYFEKWRLALGNVHKKVFKKTDKICSKHFNKDDIITSWDNIINGELVQLLRDKPKLKDTAVPISNLPKSVSLVLKAINCKFFKLFLVIQTKTSDDDEEKCISRSRTAKSRKLASIIRSPLKKNNKIVKKGSVTKKEAKTEEKIVILLIPSLVL